MAQFNFTRPHKLGSELCAADREEALMRFPHRYTLDHKPDWAYATAYNGREYPPQFMSDWDWLAHTWFQVREDGRLDGRSHSCHSFPTWPLGKMNDYDPRFNVWLEPSTRVPDKPWGWYEPRD